MNIPWDQIIEVVILVIQECTEASREQKIAQIRNPGRVVCFVVRRAAKSRGIELTAAQWEEVFAEGAKLSDPEIELLLSDWSAW